MFTDRLTFSEAKNVTVSTGGKIGLVVFDGTLNQRVSLKVVPGPTGEILLYKPDGTLFASSTIAIGTFLIEPPLLPAAGTYTVNVDLWLSSTGTETLTLYDVPPDVTGTIPFATAQTAALNTPGQNARYTFSGTTGQRVSLKVDAYAPTGTVSLKHPDGSTLGSGNSGVFAGFIDTVTLLATGTHTVLADPSHANTGSMTVTLYDVPADVTGTLTPASGAGSSVTVPLNTPGQNALYTFTGTTGQRVSLKVGANAPTGTVSLVNPSGGALGSANSGVSASFMEPKTLTAAGTHTIKVDPGVYNTGSTTVTAYDVPADSAGTIAVGGASVGVSLGTAGQNGTLTFSGTSGQQVTVRLTSNTFGLVTVKLLKPDGN
ncbi:MAG: hypothetical protein ACRDH5_13865, partial [bacterium]